MKESILLFIMGAMFGLVFGYVFGRGSQLNLEGQLSKIEEYIMNSARIEYDENAHIRKNIEVEEEINMDCFFDNDTPPGPNCK